MNQIPVHPALKKDRNLDVAFFGSVGMGSVYPVDFDLYLLSGQWRWGDDRRYTYAAGFIRTIEHRMISQERFLRLAEARRTEDVFSMLGDTDYAQAYQDDIGASEAVYDINRILADEEKRVRALVDSLGQDKEVTDLLFVRYDFFNVKLAVKSIYRGMDAKESFSDLGTVSPLMILQEVRDPEKSNDLPAHLKEAAVAAREAYDAEKRPVDIDLAVDRVMYEYLINRAKSLRELLLYKLLVMEVDITNILTFLRLKWLGEPLAVLQEGFIEGGSLDRARFVEEYPREIEEVEAEFFTRMEYVDLTGDGIPHLKSSTTFSRLEALMENEILRLLERVRLINFGVEVLIDYFYRKNIEIKKLRTVVLGKENGLTADDIKMRLGYVSK